VFASSVSGTGVFGNGNLGGGAFQASNGHGVLGKSEAANKAGVYGESTSGKNNIAGVYGKGDTVAPGVYGTNNSDIVAAVKGVNSAGIGVHGIGGRQLQGVLGESSQGIAVWGKSGDFIGVWGQSVKSHGVAGGFASSGIPKTQNLYGGIFEGLAVDGHAYINGHSYAIKHQNVSNVQLDLAEWVKVNDPSIEKGDVLVLDKNIDKCVTKSSISYSTLVAGIVSSDPAFVAGLHGEGDNVLSDEEMEAKGYRMLALAGQVPCKVSTENGPIERGDLLTASNTPGYAMKATDPKIGTILGKAMEPLAAGKGKIVVLVTLQ
jgi:hypothetical protein